jgi:hypothetical protein
MGNIFSLKLQPHIGKHHRLPENQRGGRKNKHFIDPDMLKTIGLEISKKTRTSYINLENDCSAAYDRVPMNLALLKAKQLGLPRSVSQLIGSTMENTCYCQRTTSTKQPPRFHYMELPKLASTHHRINLSTAMEEMNYLPGREKFSNPTQSIVTASHQMGFIDDTNNICNNFVPELEEAQNTGKLE